MPLPRDIGQLTTALLFRPGAVDTLGLRIAIAARMPERYGQPTVFLEATLCDLTPEDHKGRFPTYRFVIDEKSRTSEPVQRTLTSGCERREQSYRSFDDDDPVKQLIGQKMAETSLVWMTFASAEWIAALGDNATLHSNDGDPEPIGEITQLTVLK